MSLARRAARAALAASFISGGIDQIRNPQPKAGPASPIAKPIADRIPQLPNDPESLVKLDGVIKVVGGLGMVFGPFARPAALLLAGSLVPTTLAGHRFWETTDPEQKVSDRVEFFKNISLVGGLLATALDTGGRPSVTWVANKAAHTAAETVGGAAGTVREGVGSVGGVVAGAAGALGGAVATGAGKAKGGAAKAGGKAKGSAAKAGGAAKGAALTAKGAAAGAAAAGKGASFTKDDSGTRLFGLGRKKSSRKAKAK